MPKNEGPKTPRDLPPSLQHIAAQPPPRSAQGMLAPSLGRALAWPFRAALAGLLALRVTPNQLTVASLLTNVAAGVLIVRGARVLPGVLVVASGILDVFDGAVARARGTSSRRGAWLDSVGDRAADAAVLGALVYALAGDGDDVLAALALGALAVSLLVSHVRAEAHALGVTMGEGLFARAERVVALALGLVVTPLLGVALAALAGLGLITLVQRMLIARAKLRGAA